MSLMMSRCGDPHLLMHFFAFSFVTDLHVLRVCSRPSDCLLMHAPLRLVHRALHLLPFSSSCLSIAGSNMLLVTLASEQHDDAG